ncbi:cytochrome c oxidase assembly protein ctaG-like [Diadema setosum]|uniref:cytochrome c oxidase assembly protein ctaG-like n=1 Tax=Diadema setosum TaxID=31175 RepID=UPI003B3AD5B4
MLLHYPSHVASLTRALVRHGQRSANLKTWCCVNRALTFPRITGFPTGTRSVTHLSCVKPAPALPWKQSSLISSSVSLENCCMRHIRYLQSSAVQTLPISTSYAFQRLTSRLPLKDCLNRTAFMPSGTLIRHMSTGGPQNPWQHRNRSVMLYVIAGAVLVVGFSYAAVPLYTVFCQATGLGGQATVGHNVELVETMQPVKDRQIAIRFNADTAASMRWNFRPQQTEIKLVPGETALAFYSAMNPTDKPIVGISTYNVVPFDAGQYFNKIQCFCFEEQRLNPHEQVDMPVFFYIDPEFSDDPKMEKVNVITLSYTFFESKEGLELPDPWSR